MEIRAGTSGYSYKEWRGAFYPEDLSPDDWLSYYASQLDAVEINNTFYRMPKTHVVEAWRDAVPEHFRFVLKASRRITHQGRLLNVEEATGYLVDRARILENHLGALLFQLPPNMKADVERLKRFQGFIPDDIPVAFEFRNSTWDTNSVDTALRDAGHAKVVSHDSAETKASESAILGGPLTYLRLRAERYSKPELRKWASRVIKSSPQQALVFFKHEDAGAGPKLAKQFLENAAQLAAKPAPARASNRKVTKTKRKGPVSGSKKTSAQAKRQDRKAD